MKKDKIIEYTFVLFFIIVTFFNLFLLNAEIQKSIITVFIIFYTIITIKIYGFKKVTNKNKSKILILIIGLSIIYVLSLYIIGIYAGFYRNINAYNGKTILKNIFTYSIFIICSEIIRQIFLSKENKKTHICITIALVVAEISICTNLSKIWDLNEILSLIGYITVPSISVNLMCNYIVKKYGLVPNILYRMVTTLYVYVFAILPDVYIFFQSIYKIIFPYIVFLIIDEFFENKKFKKVAKREKISLISLCASISIVVLIVMLVSCKFKYGILVVGSSSMAGTIDKGDAIIYKRFENEQLKKGQVIVFMKDDIKTIHSVESVEIKNNEIIYLTKGTNNEQQDEGYRTNADIVGTVKFKIIDIGWPTIWLNEVFDK